MATAATAGGEWGPGQRCVIVQAPVHLPSVHFQRPAAKSLLETSLHSICKAHVLLGENKPSPGREASLMQPLFALHQHRPLPTTMPVLSVRPTHRESCS